MRGSLFHGSTEKARLEEIEKARFDRDRHNAILSQINKPKFVHDDIIPYYVTVDVELVDQRFKNRLHHGPETFFHYTPLGNLPVILRDGIRASVQRKYVYVSRSDWNEFIPMTHGRRIARLTVKTNWSFELLPLPDVPQYEWVTSPLIPVENIMKVEFSGIFNLTGLAQGRIDEICDVLEGVESESIYHD